jgi:alcohol dehydrogenase (cytochrome c)
MMAETSQGHKGRGGHKAAVLVAALAASSGLGAQQDGQWLMYSGSYDSHRFSPLAQITTDNVAKLRPAWVYQPPGTGSVESTPVVANGVMYVTSGPTMVAALDLKSGKSSGSGPADCAERAEPWLSSRQPRCGGSRQHGLRRPLDGYLFALDARSGTERYRCTSANRPATRYRGAARRRRQGDRRNQRRRSGIRGFLDVTCEDRKQVWRFYTIPSPGEPGSEGWPATAGFMVAARCG